MCQVIVLTGYSVENLGYMEGLLAQLAIGTNAN